MASPFQQQSLYRKLTYAALILVLFTVAWGWRTREISLFGMDIKGVDKQAESLSIREQSHGEVDWLGALARLSTIGTRGAATCVLWVNAQEAQKKNQWNELELYARSLTKLQPHFITPWIFQSWNLSYNVSVESDRINDKYFYITRGIGLLAEGERQNRDNPDIRWSIGFFMQHKICQSDETNVLRSLSQLSMIPPNERDPGRFWTASQEINWTELEDFCKMHPQLVRRLREGIRKERRSEQLRQFRCEKAEDVVQFLQDNFRVPTLWVDPLNSSAPGAWKPKQESLKPLADRFPVLPPRHETSRPYQQPPDPTALHDESQLLDEHDAYQLARAWYSYSQEPLPEPDRLPGSSKQIVNSVYQRMNKHSMTIIFRTHPAQAQRFTAERLQEEGWFDDSGWDISDWFSEGFSGDKQAVVGGGKYSWSLVAWKRALEAWNKFGTENHLLLSTAEQENLEKRAKAFAEKKHIQDAMQLAAMRDEGLDPETKEELFAAKFLRDLVQYKTICNFDVHYNRAQIESQEATVQARKIFFEALDAQRLRNDEPAALRKYLDPAGMKAWRDKVLMKNKVFRNDSLIQEQTYQIQLRYSDLYSRLHGRGFKAQAAGLLLIPALNPPGGGVCPLGLAIWLPTLIEKDQGKEKTSLKVDWDNPLLGGPFDVNDEEGQPLISEVSRRQVLQRLYPTLFGPVQQDTPPPRSEPMSVPIQ